MRLLMIMIASSVLAWSQTNKPLRLEKTIELPEDDADNLRYDADHERIYVGYGGGGLGEINTEGQKVAEIKLGTHPESFQLEHSTPRIYVNLPKSHKISVVDRDKHTVIASWGTGMAFANYPMASDEKDHRLFVVTAFRRNCCIEHRNREDRSKPFRSGRLR